MQVPLQITFRDIAHSSAVETHIRKKAKKLNQFSAVIISCRVVIEQIQKHQNNGKLYNVRLATSLPNHIELIVNHNPNENLYISIRDAFDNMTRKIEDAMSRMKGEVKAHPELISGKIVRIFDYDGFGFIEGIDGNEYYFSANNVVHPHFGKLAVGSQVHFITTVGEGGLQARRVSTGR